MGTGHTPNRSNPSYWDGPFRWIGIRDARAHHGRQIWETSQTITQEGLDNSSARLLPAGTVALSRTASVGYVVQLGREMATSQDFFTWTCGAALEPRFLMYALQAEGDGIRDFGEGSTHTTIYFPELKALHLKTPPAAEQRRIVVKIDRLSARSKRASDELERVRKLVTHFKRAILAAAYSSRYSKGAASKTAALSSFISSLDQGWSPKCEADPAPSGSWAVMKTTAVQPFHFDAAENKALPPVLSPRGGLVIQRGDIIVTRAGPRSRVGITCMSTQDHPGLMLCDKAYRLRVDEKVVDPKYICLMLNSPQCMQAIEAIKTGGNDSGLNLTQARFLAVRLPALPLAKQTAIVHSIEHAFAAIDRLVAEAQSARALLDTLDQAFLAKAFRGELMPQNLNDEPASVLLERIRAERAADPTKARGRRKAS